MSIRKGLCAAILALLLTLCGCSAASAPAPLEVTLLQVGKADAMVLCCGGETLIIDTGDVPGGERLLRFLEDQGIERIDALIITHFDRDHLGGAALLLQTIAPGRVLMPDYEGDSDAYFAFLEAMDATGITPERLRQPTEFSLGDASVLVEPPEDYTPHGSGEQDNNFSLVTTVGHGEKRLVFAGDIEKRRIRAYLKGESAVACDFLKVPHHGVYNAALAALFDRLSPSAAVICDANEKPADSQTLELLRQRGIQVYETRNGDVQVISDGTSLEIRQG